MSGSWTVFNSVSSSSTCAGCTSNSCWSYWGNIITSDRYLMGCPTSISTSIRISWLCGLPRSKAGCCTSGLSWLTNQCVWSTITTIQVIIDIVPRMRIIWGNTICSLCMTFEIISNYCCIAWVVTTSTARGRGWSPMSVVLSSCASSVQLRYRYE